MRYPGERSRSTNLTDETVKSRWRLLRTALPGEDDDGWTGWPAGLSPPGARRCETELVDDCQDMGSEPGTPWHDDDGRPHETTVDPVGALGARSGFVSAWRGALAFTREHVVVVFVALAVVVVFVAMTYLRSRADEVPLAPEISLSAIPTPDSSPIVVKVHVLGAVFQPGVVTLPEGARVEDAIVAAGGLTGDADPAQLNLAAVVADGSQIVIGTISSPVGEVNDTSGGVTGGAGAKVNINTASEAELETLPGVGPATAQKILTYRSQHGRFSAVDQLQEVDGIGPKTMAQLEPYVCV